MLLLAFSIKWIQLGLGLCYFNRSGSEVDFYSENGLEVTFWTALQNRNPQMPSSSQSDNFSSFSAEEEMEPWQGVKGGSGWTENFSPLSDIENSALLLGQRGTLSVPRRRVLKDYSNRHSDLRQHENRFLGLTSAWKLVFRPDIDVKTSFHADYFHAD